MSSGCISLQSSWVRSSYLNVNIRLGLCDRVRRRHGGSDLHECRLKSSAADVTCYITHRSVELKAPGNTGIVWIYSIGADEGLIVISPRGGHLTGRSVSVVLRDESQKWVNGTNAEDPERLAIRATTQGVTSAGVAEERGHADLGSAGSARGSVTRTPRTFHPRLATGVRLTMQSEQKTKGTHETAASPCGLRWPWSAWLRGRLCSRLRFVWVALMVITVFCVAVQILGVVRQSRSNIVLKHTNSENLFKMQFPKMYNPRKGDSHLSWHMEAVRKDSAAERHGPGSPVPFKWDDKVWNSRGPKGDSQSASTRSMGAGIPHPAGGLVRSNSGSSRGHQSNMSPLLSQLRTGVSAEHKVTLSRKVTSLSQALDPGSNRSRTTLAGSAGCRPKNHIMFLKTHKTASSTILNILYRYGDRMNLTFALPRGQRSQLFYPLVFSAHFVEGFPLYGGRPFDIMCNHMRFAPHEVQRIMPPDTFYFSIVRNPILMMESSFVYYKSIPAFAKAKNLDDFLSNTWKDHIFSTDSNQYAKNLLTFDFGFNNVDDDDRQTGFIISLIEKYFHLILIAEHFDESMILLKHTLCWTLDDVVSFKLNSRSDDSRQKLSPQTTEKIKAWNSRDWKLYLHFNTTFWKKVDATVGQEAMKAEVAKLRERRAELMKTCLMDGGAVDPSKVKDKDLKPFQYGSAIIQGYNLNSGLTGVIRKLCRDLITPELQYTQMLYAKQFPELSSLLDNAQKQRVSNKTTIARSKVLDVRKG
ncbi:hypothetical protein GN956_G7791 [Arapaima gigas]